MNVAIVVAAGKGTRLGGNQPKQFLKLDGIPVIIHTLKRFEQCKDIHEVVVVLPNKEVAKFPALLGKYGLSKVNRCVAGGDTRADSVRRGFESIDSQGVKIVAIHDGVRPFVGLSEISRTVRAAIKYGAAILAVPVTDTIKVVRYSQVSITPPRTDLWRALTPQCFDYETLLRVYAAGKESPTLSFTDDSAFVAEVGRVGVMVVEGDSRNIKITQGCDIGLAEVILKQNPEFRIKK
jgi:2-C-methyl-D-erythritol 4-phosphate cytidylyltransferase